MVFKSQARYDPVKFHAYGKDQGLMNSRVNSIIEDDRGYMWVGTRGGLFRFDGYQFQPFYHNQVDSTTISADDVSCLMKASDGTIWVGTWEGGLNRLDPLTGQFTRYFNHGPTNSNTIKNLVEDKAGMIWVSTFGGGLFRLNPKTGEFKSCTFRGYDGEMAFDYIETMVHLRDTVWIGSLFDGLGYCPVNQTSVSRYQWRDSSSIANVVSYMAVDQANNLVLADRQGGLLTFNTRINRAQPLPRDSALPGVAHGYIWTLLPDDEGQIWVGTMAGLSLYQPSLKGYRNLKNVAADANSLSSNTVYSLFKDSRGVIWIGTWEGGLVKFDPNTWHFKEFNLLEFKPEQRKVFNVIQLSNYEYLLGTNKGMLLVDRRSYETKPFKVTGEQATFVNQNVIRGITRDFRDSSLLLVCDQGLFSLNPKTRQVRPFLMNDGTTIPSIEYNTMFVDQDRDLWLGSMAQGIVRVDLMEGTYKTYLHNDANANTVRSNFVQSFYQDRQGVIWVGTKNGLNKYLPEKDHFERVDPTPTKGVYLSKLGIRAIAEGSKDELWLATSGGLVRLDYSTNDMKIFRKEDGLIDNVVYGLVLRKGVLYGSTNKGLFSFDERTRTIKNFTEKDGLLSNEYNYGSYGKFNTGEVYFGSNKGVNFFSPVDLPENPIRAEPYISAILVRDSALWNNWQSKGEVTVLDYKNKTVSFQFSAVNFTRPKEVRFLYRLTGFEKDWHEVKWNNRTATYTNLDPGLYEFHVKTLNSDGLVSRNHAKVRIEVIPPFWKTWWFVTFLVLLLGAVVYGVFRARVYQLAVQKRQLEQEVHLRTKEIAQQKLEMEALYEETQDNINTAKFIQLSILPTAASFEGVFDDHFVLFKPRNVVSGDFYWLKQKGQKVYFAVADCTGHGVYGAFTSLIAHNQLNSSLKDLQEPSAAALLDHVNHGVISALQQKEQDLSHSAGMDVCLGVLDLSTNRLEYAGAHNPLYILRNNDIIQHKGNSFSVGMPRSMVIQSFTNHHIQLEEGDILYLFSDGFADQKGGEKGKKFYYPHFRDLLIRTGNLPLVMQRKELDQIITEWMNGYQQVDDILVMGLKIRAV